MTYAEFAELFVKHILKGFGRVDVTVDYYKTKSIKSSEQLLRGQSEKIHVASLFSMVANDFHNRTLKLW